VITMVALIVTSIGEKPGPILPALPVMSWAWSINETITLECDGH